MYLMVEIKTIFTQYWIHEAFEPKGKLSMNGNSTESEKILLFIHIEHHARVAVWEAW